MDQEVRDGERDGSVSEASMGVVDESEEVRDGERDGAGSEASMGVVDESKAMRDGERDGRGPEDTMGMVYKSKLEGVLKIMEPLPGVISDLLRQRQHGGRRLTAAVDRTLRSWQFIEYELRSLIASLRELQVQLPHLGADFIYCDDRMKDWLRTLLVLCIIIPDQLSGAYQRLPRFNEAAALCFRPKTRRSLFYSWNRMQNIALAVYLAAESPCRYKHLMLAGDGERTSRAYAAHTGAGASLVGIEGALRSKQLRWFMAASREADNKSLKVMAMVGPAGVGKTTLAMEVHRQLQQTEGFQLCATAKVSQSPDIRELLKHILSQIEDKPAAHDPDASNQTSQITTLEEARDEMLTYKINQCLQEKRYLVTIHDVWKEIDWNVIKNAFPENNLDSRIMITTQLRSVAQFCCSHCADGLVHEVKPLGALDSKKLLIKKAFDPEDSCPPEYFEVCEEILRRCEGIPLFIIGMAGWLHEQLQKAQGTNYRMETVPKLLKQFEQALATIYDDVPYHLKVMLMYMSVFTEGYTFDKETLIEKWINLGMISCYHSSESDTDEARKFVRELIDRNVVTRVEASGGHNIQVEEAYHLHIGYFMLQFLASKSAQFVASESAEDHGFVCTLDSLRAEGGKTVLRRLSLHQPHPELLTLLQRMDLSCTRLLSVSGEVSQIPLDEFSHLVVLDLEGWQCFKDDDMLLVCKMYLLQNLSLRNVTGVSKLPPEIKELKYLVSLDISQTSICELPSQIRQLQWLQKLDLRSTKVRQLPHHPSIWSLERLLVGGDGVAGNETVIEISEESIKCLRRLRILTVVDLTRCSPSLVDALGALKDLVELAITWSFHQCTDGRFQEALRSSTRKWFHLYSLTIHCGLGCHMDFLDFSREDHEYACPNIRKFQIVDGIFASVPKWFSELRDLTFIQITVCALLPGDLGILGNLDLECLVLGLHFIPEAALVIGAGFLELQRLSVSCRVPWLTFTQGAMPALTFLELKIAGYPASQENIPSGITNLGRLSDVSIRFHKNYVNSPNVKMTVEAVRKEIAEHRMPINLFINDVEDQGEDFQAAEEGLPRASGRQSEIQNEESSIGEQEEDVQAVEAGPASEIEEEE